MLVGEMAGAIPSSFWGTLQTARPLLSGLGLALALLVGWLLWRAPLDVTEKRRLRFLAVAALLSVLPMAGGVVDGRMLVLPLLASMPLIATALESNWTTPGSLPKRIGVKTVVMALGFLHFGLAAFVRIGLTELMVKISADQKTLAETFDASACDPGDSGLILTGADPALSLSGAPSLVYTRPETKVLIPHVYVLSLAPHDQRLERIAQNAFILHVDDLPRRSTIFESLYSDEPSKPGQRIDFGKLKAEVIKTDAGLPTRVRFEFPSNHCLLVWKNKRLVSMRSPAVGQTLEIAHEPGPLGL